MTFSIVHCDFLMAGTRSRQKHNLISSFDWLGCTSWMAGWCKALVDPCSSIQQSLGDPSIHQVHLHRFPRLIGLREAGAQFYGTRCIIYSLRKKKMEVRPKSTAFLKSMKKVVFPRHFQLFVYIWSSECVNLSAVCYFFCCLFTISADRNETWIDEFYPLCISARYLPKAPRD